MYLSADDVFAQTHTDFEETPQDIRDDLLRALLACDQGNAWDLSSQTQRFMEKYNGCPRHFVVFCVLLTKDTHVSLATLVDVHRHIYKKELNSGPLAAMTQKVIDVCGSEYGTRAGTKGVTRATGTWAFAKAKPPATLEQVPKSPVDIGDTLREPIEVAKLPVPDVTPARAWWTRLINTEVAEGQKATVYKDGDTYVIVRADGIEIRVRQS